MYNTFITSHGTTCILDALMKDTAPVFDKVIKSLNNQGSTDDLLCFMVHVFSDDFKENFGTFDKEILQKFVLCAINIRHYLIDDHEEFCEEFNMEGLDLEIGFDKQTFYP